MNDIPKVSIVVPIYNVERYLRQCVDSILSQTLKDIEVILVNDGSPDNCSAIIEEYARADSRVKVITQLNSGYGKAVNRGLDMARGEYVGIIEPDDWIEPDMYESLYTVAKEHQLQIAKGYFYKYTACRGDFYENLLPLEYTNKVINPKLNATIAFYPQISIWSAIYKRSFLESYHIRCLESPGASYQDCDFGFKALIMADRMWILPRPLLHYRCDNPTQSTNSSVAKSKIFCVIDEWNEVERYLENYPALKKASYPLREHLKIIACSWFLTSNYQCEEQDRFRLHCRKIFESAMQKGVYNRDYFDSKTWYRLQLGLYPHSVKVRFKKMLRKMFSWLWKERLIENSKIVYYLFRIIRVYEKEIKRPVVHYSD